MELPPEDFESNADLDYTARYSPVLLSKVLSFNHNPITSKLAGVGYSLPLLASSGYSTATLRRIILLVIVGLLVLLLSGSVAYGWGWKTWEEVVAENPSNPPQIKHDYYYTTDDKDYEWTWTDTGLELALVGLAVADRQQTLEFTQNHDKYPTWTESNPFLGRHPSRDKLNAAIVLGLGAHYLIARELPRPFRTIWQAVFIGIEIDAVSCNYMGGVRVSF